MKTPFEVAQEQVNAGQLQKPDVSYGSKAVDYFSYQLAVHHFNMKIFAGGMTMRGIKFTHIKKYYGLKGKSAKECLPQFEQIMNDYKKKFELKQMGTLAN
jgi:hypothetical protein